MLSARRSPATFTLGSQSVLSNHIAHCGSSARTTIAHSPVAVRLLEAQTRVALTDSAVRVMTDFTRERPQIIAGDASTDDALRGMMLAAVCALLVVQDGVVLGLITAHDIQRKRRSQLMRASNYTRYGEIQVRHVMTPWARVPTLNWQLVRRAQVLDLVGFFKATLTTHTVIVEYDERGASLVRGLTSRARLERQLGHSLAQ
jgi:CBS domain-containing protein